MIAVKLFLPLFAGLVLGCGADSGREFCLGYGLYLMGVVVGAVLL